jgi:hypothetical protein
VALMPMLCARNEYGEWCLAARRENGSVMLPTRCGRHIFVLGAFVQYRPPTCEACRRWLYKRELARRSKLNRQHPLSGDAPVAVDDAGVRGIGSPAVDTRERESGPVPPAGRA